MTEYVYEIIKALNYLNTRELEEGWLECFEQEVKNGKNPSGME